MKGYAVIRALLPLLRRHAPKLVLTVVLGFLVALSEGIGLSLFIPLFYSIQPASAPPADGLLAEMMNRMGSQQPLIVALCILAALLIKNILRYANGLLASWIDVRMLRDLRLQALDGLLGADLAYLERTETGRLLNILSKETWDTSTAVQHITALLIHAATAAVFALLLLLISWELTLAVGGVLALISAAVVLMTRRVKHLSDRGVLLDEQFAQQSLEIFRGMRTIRAFGLERRVRARYDGASEAVSTNYFRMERLLHLMHPLSEVLLAAMIIAILLSSFHLAHGLPLVLTFLVVLYRFYPQIQHIDDKRARLLALSGPVERVMQSMAQPPRPVTGRQARFEREIVFDGVTFRYAPDQAPALRDITFRIPKGRMTAIVGPSGAGKTTLINLLMRFYEVGEGRLLVDGIPIARLDEASWRRRLAYVGQDAHLFNTTIRENIACSRPGASDAEIEEAARMAHAHGFIAAMREGYDTAVADLGIRLSGGQRQRIALARALLRDPDLLILDEATNALDSISEQAVRKTLEAERHRRTIVVVAHRLATIRQADHIVVIDAGRVAEQGSLDELLRNDSLFARLYELQHLEVPV